MLARIAGFMFLASFVIGGEAGATTTVPESFEALTQRLAKATVMVCTCEIVSAPPKGLPCGKIESKGSGFFVNADGLLMTARHVMPGPLAPNKRILVIRKNADGTLWWAMSDRLQAQYPEVDAVTVQFALKGQKTDWLPLSPDPVQQGEEVAIFGYPADSVSVGADGELSSETISSRVAKTIVSSVERRTMVFVPNVNLISKELVEAQFTFAKGNSGGPLVSVRSGKVVGLVTGAMNIPQGVVPVGGDSKHPLQGVPFATYSYAVSVSELKARLTSSLYSVNWEHQESAKL